VVICLERGADLHTAQLMPLQLPVSCFSKIQIGFTFLVPAHPGSPGQRAVKQVRVSISYLDLRDKVHILNGTSIGFAVFVGPRLWPTDRHRQTDHATSVEAGPSYP